MDEHSQKQIKEVIENLEQGIPYLRKAMVEFDVREKHDRFSAAEGRELLEKAYNLEKYLRDQICVERVKIMVNVEPPKLPQSCDSDQFLKTCALGRFGIELPIGF